MSGAKPERKTPRGRPSLGESAKSDILQLVANSVRESSRFVLQWRCSEIQSEPGRSSKDEAQLRRQRIGRPSLCGAVVLRCAVLRGSAALDSKVEGQLQRNDLVSKSWLSSLQLRESNAARLKAFPLRCAYRASVPFLELRRLIVDSIGAVVPVNSSMRGSKPDTLC